MSEKKILVADAEKNIVNSIKEAFEAEGHAVISASDGEEALRMIYEESPDLLILDADIPKKSGYQVIESIKQDMIHSHLPVVLLSSKGDLKNKISGLGAGVDDYITKPFDSFELLARVETILRRAVKDMESNPLTKFPGNVAIVNELAKRIRSGAKFAVIYLDINNFKAFNDKYGFGMGDKAIMLTANIMLKVIREMGDAHDFIGHIGGDDFIGIICPEKVDIICARIIKIFDGIIPSLYESKDKKRGYIVTEDRHGGIRKFPFISLSLGVVTNTNKELTHPGEISTIGAELKKYAKIKGRGKSYYTVDRRKDLENESL